MDIEIAGKHALITGASRGIGEVIAAELTARGARCTLVARDSETLDQTAARHGAFALPADLSDPADIDDLVARAEEVQGPLDILVNNAARTSMRDFWELPADELRGTVTINLLAAMELARQVVRRCARAAAARSSPCRPSPASSPSPVSPLTARPRPP